MRFSERLNWRLRDNSILLDISTFDFKIHNRTRGKMRLFLGEFEDKEFKPTVDTIKELDSEQDEQVREMVKFIMLEVLKRNEHGKLENDPVPDRTNSMPDSSTNGPARRTRMLNPS